VRKSPYKGTIGTHFLKGKREKKKKLGKSKKGGKGGVWQTMTEERSKGIKVLVAARAQNGVAGLGCERPLGCKEEVTPSSSPTLEQERRCIPLYQAKT